MWRRLFLVIGFAVISAGASADDAAEQFVKVFQMYCVEPRGKADLIDKLVNIGGWVALPADMVAAGASPDAVNSRGFELQRSGATYMLNYSDSGGCAILTKGPAAQAVQDVVQDVYKISGISVSKEGFQAMKMLRFSPESWYAGAMIIIGYIPGGDVTVVNLAFVPKYRVDRIR